MLFERKILVIDDAAPIRTFLRISLQAQGADYYEAGTAQSGLDISQRIKPDVIVLDLGLPDRDGLDILAQLKEKGANGQVPLVVVLTVRKEENMISRAYALGADAYITKPFLMEDLLEILHAQLEEPSGKAAALAQPR
jgi:DNA-binding response OmpR family regulator